MSTPAVRVENLAKRFEVGELGTAYDLVRQSKKLVRRLTRTMPTDIDPLRPWEHDDADNAFWALKGVDFEVGQGEVVGIIGRNGAGKSTLLKILSRITAPTAGRIELNGRVAALLEVGTGFHIELTGRENVYLNGAILGMTKREVNRKLDAIIDFSGIEQFLDTPVKRYSSGMKVRLGFAVAAHLEPEILIVDEVLAVGDAHFQAKCVSKMEEVATGQGRTVLFVSHNMATMKSLCERVVLMDEGRVIADGGAEDVVSRYLSTVHARAAIPIAQREDRHGTGHVRLERLTVNGQDADEVEPVVASGDEVRFALTVNPPASGISLKLSIYDMNGQRVTTFDNARLAPGDAVPPGDVRTYECIVDELALTPGRYRLNVTIRRSKDTLDSLSAVGMLNVLEGTVGGRAVTEKTQGLAVLPYRWIGEGALAGVS